MTKTQTVTSKSKKATGMVLSYLGKKMGLTVVTLDNFKPR